MGIRGLRGQHEATYGPLDDIAWDSENSGASPHAVGEKHANGFGLYDMLGKCAGVGE